MLLRGCRASFSDPSCRAGGVYYRGVVNEVFQKQPELEATEEQQEAYDPWEAVEVAWDGKSGGYAGKVPDASAHRTMPVFRYCRAVLNVWIIINVRRDLACFCRPAGAGESLGAGD